jgi:hypothetical protein
MVLYTCCWQPPVVAIVPTAQADCDEPWTMALQAKAREDVI